MPATNGVNGHTNGTNSQQWADVNEEAFTNDEAKVLKMVKHVFADYFSEDSYDGRMARLERGKLGLVEMDKGKGGMVPDMKAGNGGEKGQALGTTQMQTPAMA